MHESALTPVAALSTRPARALASLKLTLAAILWLAAAVAWSFDTGASATWSLAAPLALIAVNLLAAVATHPAFRRNLPLLVFHLCLIAIVLLVAASRLTYLRGRAELSSGETFTGALVDREAGPLHAGALASVRFVNDGFEIDYAAGRRRADTRNTVRVAGPDGRPRAVVVGDDRPLVAAGYRFYTSPNKGFAPRLRWTPAGGEPMRGTVHMPPYPVYENVQVARWTPAGANVTLVIALEIGEVLIDPDRPARFRMPAAPRLVVGEGSDAVTLAPGAAASVAGGTLAFEGLTTWMGYTVHYDPAMPWLLAACLMACASIGAHFARRFRARPWNP